MTAVCIAQITSGQSGADTAFVPGTATATAQAIQVAPTTGSLSYAVILATSQAAYQNDEGQALSQTLDVGAIGTALEADNCETGQPTIQPSQLPQPLQAESTNGNQSLSSTEETSLQGTGAGVGNESATATTQPLGGAITAIAQDNLANLVDVSHAVTAAQSSVQNGATRLANATADIGTLSLENGLVQMQGLHWAATQSTGAASASSGTFTVGGLTIAGTQVPISNDSIQTILSIVNTALGPSGLAVQWPQASTLSDGTEQISPLIVGVDNSALGQQVVGANLGQAEPVRDALQQALLNLNCNTSTGLLLGDIGLGVLAGGGDLNIELGGASAVTNDQAFTSPFGSAGAPGSLLGIAPLPVDTGSFATPGTTGAVTGGTGTGASGSGSSGSGGQQVALGPISRSVSCRSTSPAGGGCAGTTMGAPVGLVGLAVLGSLAAWDFTRQRRRGRAAAREAMST
jgi:hypothetical protein